MNCKIFIPNENLNILGYNIVAEIDRLDFPVGLIGINQSSYAVKFLTSIEARGARGVLITIAHDECIFLCEFPKHASRPKIFSFHLQY